MSFKALLSRKNKLHLPGRSLERLGVRDFVLEMYFKGKSFHKEKCVGLPSCPDQTDKCNCFVLWTISVIAAAVIQLCSCARLLLALGVISRAVQRPPLSEVSQGTAVQRDRHCSWQKFGCFLFNVSLCIR